MLTQRVSTALMLTNLVLLLFVLGQSRGADADTVAPVLRGRALEIVDDAGRVRASISVLPADPAAELPDGTTGYPETVLLRLINTQGSPNVKVAATEDGSGLSLGGEASPTHIQMIARGGNTTLKLVNKQDRVQVVQP